MFRHELVSLVNPCHHVDMDCLYNQAHAAKWGHSMVIVVTKVRNCYYFYDRDAQILLDFGNRDR